MIYALIAIGLVLFASGFMLCALFAMSASQSRQEERDREFIEHENLLEVEP